MSYCVPCKILLKLDVPGQNMPKIFSQPQPFIEGRHTWWIFHGGLFWWWGEWVGACPCVRCAGLFRWNCHMLLSSLEAKWFWFSSFISYLILYIYFAGLSDPEMRAIVRHNLLHPSQPDASENTSHILLWVTAIALVLVFFALALSVWYYKSRWVS